MVNAQEWLDKNYQNKNQAKPISLNDLNFEQPSELVIDNYPNLKEISGLRVSNLTKLTISNCPRLEKVDVRNFKNIQELILHNLPKLKELSCYSSNKLTTLDLIDCSNLQKIDCSDNKNLTQVKIPQEEKLEWLDLKNNNLNQDLSFLKDLVNLKELELENNRFKGSLEPLKNMNKLEKLDISNTDIDSGLEHLSESLKEFYCSVDRREDAKCQFIYDLLSEGKTDDDYIKNFAQRLRDYKQNIVKEKEQKREDLIKDLQEQLSEVKLQLEQKESSKLKNLRQEIVTQGMKNQTLTENLTKAQIQLTSYQEQVENLTKKIEESREQEIKLVRAETELNFQKKYLEKLENQSNTNQSENETKVLKEWIEDKKREVKSLEEQANASQEDKKNTLEIIKEMKVNLDAPNQEEETKSPGRKINEGFGLIWKGVGECLVQEVKDKIPFSGLCKK